MAAFVTLGTTQLAQASSHREAPGTSKDPVADNTDVWAWHTGDAATGALHVVVSYNPFEEPAGGPNFHTFGDDVLYEIHVARGSASLDDVVTYQLRFATTPPPTVAVDNLALPPGGGKEFFTQLSGASQTYTLTQVVGGVSTQLATGEVVPPNIGPRTNANGPAYKINGTQIGATKADYEAFALSKVQTFGTGGKVWAGPRDDGFYVDLGGVFDLAGLRPQVVAGATAQDGVSGFNAHTIALDIPAASIPAAAAGGKAAFNNRLGIWASASRRKMTVLRNDGTKQGFGPWVQVSRLGLPLINEVIIGLQDKDKYNRTQPKNDVANFGAYILNPVIVRDAEAVGIYTALGADPTPFKSGRTDIVQAINVLAPVDPDGTGPADAFPLATSGDVLRVDFDLAVAFPNGRPLGPQFFGGAANKETDVTDVLSTIVLTNLTNFANPAGIKITDGVNSNDAPYTDTFPYLPTPWTGFNEGHGKPAP